MGAFKDCHRFYNNTFTSKAQFNIKTFSCFSICIENSTFQVISISLKTFVQQSNKTGFRFLQRLHCHNWMTKVVLSLCYVVF